MALCVSAILLDEDKLHTPQALLSNNPVYSSLTQKEIQGLIQIAACHRYRKGEAIAHIGEIWPYIFFIYRGQVNAVKKSMEGRNLVVTSFNAGEIFWGLAFFQDELVMPVSLESSEPTQIYLWTRDQMHPVLQQKGEISWQLSRLMISRMARASEILDAMAFQPVGSRLAKLLMDLRQDYTKDSVARSLTLDEMAARIGSTREMVCRFLHRFADEGIIDITRTEYRITDQERLAQIIQSAKG